MGIYSFADSLRTIRVCRREMQGRELLWRKAKDKKREQIFCFNVALAFVSRQESRVNMYANCLEYSLQEKEFHDAYRSAREAYWQSGSWLKRLIVRLFAR